ncbi:MAG: RNA degradosome polyphosphate kinase [Immundisolibacterales bacterium]|nr:RNA degradosome polyphosphate kinase [Immundisolibacterales bacterium]
MNASPPAIDSDTPERFINRELSWLAFNERVLEEAWNPRVPLLERVRFLAISAANLNEFYMVRVAGLNGQVEAGIASPSQDGMTPAEQLAAIADRAHSLMDGQQRCWEALVDEMRGQGIFVLDESELDRTDLTWLDGHFMTEIFPVLSPIASDPSHPFPFIPNLGFSLVVRCARDGEEAMFGLVPIPQGIPRFVPLPGDEARFIPVEQVIRAFVDRLFPGFRVEDSSVCRVLRDSDVEIEEEAEDLVREFERLLRERRRGDVIRLTVDRNISEDLESFLMDKIGVASRDLVASQRLLGLADTSELVLESRPELLFSPFTPRATERVRDSDGDCFAAIRKSEFIVHHPYEEFDVVVEFLRQAAADPSVVSIKQTLYRTSDDSPIVAALAAAAYAGKSVTALVELKARFDEERNLRWARNLESAGVNVVYGFVRLKTHAKVSLVVRREWNGLRSYAHFGTGNYHPVTARIYTDISFFTCDRALCRDAAKLFNYMTSTAPPDRFEKLAVSPLNLRERLAELIDAEIEHARAGREAAIVAKLNSLVDGRIIEHLYRASQAGVSIDLVVRGICSLRPGVPGLSENIRVKSIVGRFLEHSRIVCFAAGHGLDTGGAKVFISSADWMPRNLDRRVETLVPIENPNLHRQVLKRIVRANLADEAQAWRLEPDGTYTRIKSRKNAFCAHDYFMSHPSLSGRGAALGKRRTRKRPARA